MNGGMAMPQENNTNTELVLTGESRLEKLPARKVSIQKLFHKVSVLDYAIMWFLADKAESADESRKFYLKELSESSGIHMHIITEMVLRLRDKGLVEWKHDGSGENGTYIRITAAGMQAVTEQRDILKNFHSNVIERFGGERFIKLLNEMSAFEDIMSEEIEREELENE